MQVEMESSNFFIIIIHIKIFPARKFWYVNTTTKNFCVEFKLTRNQNLHVHKIKVFVHVQEIQGNKIPRIVKFSTLKIISQLLRCRKLNAVKFSYYE